MEGSNAFVHRGTVDILLESPGDFEDSFEAIAQDYAHFGDSPGYNEIFDKPNRELQQNSQSYYPKPKKKHPPSIRNRAPLQHDSQLLPEPRRIIPTNSRPNHEISCPPTQESRMAPSKKVPLAKEPVRKSIRSKKSPSKEFPPKRPPNNLAQDENDPAQAESLNHTQNERDGENTTTIQGGTAEKVDQKGSKRKAREAALEKYVEDHYEVDRKLKSEERLQMIKKLRTEYYTVKINEETRRLQYVKNMEELKNTNGKLEKEKEALVKEKEDLQNKLELSKKSLESVRAAKKFTAKLEINQELKNLVEDNVKNILWTRVKFIQSDEEEETAAMLLLKYGDLPEEHKKSKKTKAIFCNTYKAIIRSALFYRRNYVTSELRKVYIKKWRNKQRTLDVNDLVKCLKRDIDTEDDMEVFMMYWEEILPKMVSKDHWKHQKYYSTITDALHPDYAHLEEKKRRKLVSAADEAAVVIFIQNAHDRWYKEYLSPKELGKKKKATGEDMRATVEEMKATGDDKSNKNGLFSSSDKGQNKWGGWSPEGLVKYKEYLRMVKDARKTEEASKVEKTCLQRLRKKYNITQSNKIDQAKYVDAQKRREKSGKAAEPTPIMQEVINTIALDTDEEDEDEEEEDDDDDE